MIRIFLFAIISLPCQCIAQESVNYFQYYRNGNVKSLAREIEKGEIQYIEYFRNGLLKDSINLKNEIPTGRRTVYYKNGNLKLLITYKDGPKEFRLERFRANGTLKFRGGKYNYKPFGHSMYYNKKGQVVRFHDYNKGRTVYVQHRYRKGRHLKGSDFEAKIEFNKAYFRQEGYKPKKIKSGALISLQTRTDTLVKQHYQIEGFSTDSIFFSCFSYDLSSNKRTLKFDSLAILGFNEIETIYFAKNNTDWAELGAMTVLLTGYILFSETLILIPIFEGFEALIDPLVIGFVLSGPPLFIWGKHLYKAIVPQKYNLKEWTLSVTKE